MNNKNIVYLPSEQLINNFINNVVQYIQNNNTQSIIENYIVIGSNYLYLEDEILDIINITLLFVAVIFQIFFSFNPQANYIFYL